MKGRSFFKKIIAKNLLFISFCTIFAVSGILTIALKRYYGDGSKSRFAQKDGTEIKQMLRTLNAEITFNPQINKIPTLSVITTKNYYSRIKQKYCQKRSLGIDLKKLEQLKHNSRLTTILVDSRNQALFCFVPKVASGNWKRIFLALTGKYMNMSSIPMAVAHNQSLLTTLGDLPVKTIRDKIKKYRSFLMVREPMERLLSAYLNKIHLDYTGKFQKLFGAKILKYTKFKKYIGGNAKWNVTFEEFVQFLTHERDAFELHWERISKICHPCLFNFDYVGHYENLFKDAERLTKLIDPKMNLAFPRYQKTRSLVSTTKSKMSTYFKTLTHNQLRELLRLYAEDYKYFGYSLPEYLFKVVKN